MPPQKQLEQDSQWELIDDIKEESIDYHDEFIGHEIEDEETDDNTSSTSTAMDFVEIEIEEKLMRTAHNRELRPRQAGSIHRDSDKPYNCTMCSFKVGGLRFLHTHVLKSHSKPGKMGKLKCVRCPFHTSNKLAFFHHILSRKSSPDFDSQCPPTPCETSSTKQKSKQQKCPNCLYGTLNEVENEGRIFKGEDKILRCWVCHYYTGKSNKNDKELVICVHCHKSVGNYAQCLKCFQKFHVSCLLQAANTTTAKCHHTLDPSKNSVVKKVNRRTKKELLLDGKAHPYKGTAGKRGKLKGKAKRGRPRKIRNSQEPVTVKPVSSDKARNAVERSDGPKPIDVITSSSLSKNRVHANADQGLEVGGDDIESLKRIIKELEEKNGLLKENCELWKNRALSLQQELDKYTGAKSNGVMKSKKK